MSGQRSTSPHQGGDTPSQPQTPTPQPTATTSSDSSALAAILAKLTNLDEQVSGLRRSMQRMDGRLDSTVGGLTSLKDRVEMMEDWIPGNDPLLEESGQQAVEQAEQPLAEETEQHSSSLAVIDSEQVPSSHTASKTSPVVVSTTSATPDDSTINQSGQQDPHGQSSATPVDQKPPPLPIKPPRPQKASTRPPHLDQPHALKPPQVRAFRKLPDDDKDEFRRLAGLVGGSVREYLDGKFDVEALAREDEADDRQSSHSSVASGASHKVDGDNDPHRTERPRHSTTALQTPPTTPVQVSTLTCKTEFLGSFDGTASELESFISRLLNLRRSDRRPAWESAVVRTLPRVLKDDAAAWHEGLSDDEADALDSVNGWVDALR
ncbi:hypothetical protein CF326_g8026 [Tilletia indica]|uniref:Uncharacterized protein n=1 Tax=Tilletia indica TaxID=43049 RepID=A0A177T571_9BASI|nr:hypothetical protein CF326_g8026 [Tilletia indica]KAE8238520.1 hypothetical protein A4X13_0g8476 [Tilletia indica]